MTEELPLKALNTYLTSVVENFSDLHSATKFANGQSNPTYLLKTSDRQFVLRRQPSGTLLKSAHAVDREFAVLKALSTTDVPVPGVFHLCMDKAVIGSMFYIMSFETGKVFWNPSLPGLSVEQRANVFDEMNRVLCSLHDVDYCKVGLSEFGKPGNYFERQINRWTRQYEASATENSTHMNHLIQWLPNNLPIDDHMVSLIHGDFRIDNMIFSESQFQVRALLDWELSTLGHPIADLAYQCMQWRIHCSEIIPGLGGVDRQKLGIPSESDYLERYCQRRGLSGISDWSFYLAFSFFRFSAILQGVKKRAIEGNASSQKAFQYGAMAPTLAAMAVRLLEDN